MWLVPKLDAFRARHPNVSVLIDSSQEIVDLRRGDVDVAIRYGVADQDGLLTNRLFVDLIFPACSPSLMEGPPMLRRLSQLKNVPLIHWDISQLTWANKTREWFDWDRWFERIGSEKMKGKSTLHFNDYGQAVQAAVAGQGVVLASGPILRDVLKTGHLVQPFGECLGSDIGFVLVTAKSTKGRQVVIDFTNWVTELADLQKLETSK